MEMPGRPGPDGLHLPSRALFCPRALRRRRCLLPSSASCRRAPPPELARKQEDHAMASPDLLQAPPSMELSRPDPASPPPPPPPPGRSSSPARRPSPGVRWKGGTTEGGSTLRCDLSAAASPLRPSLTPCPCPTQINGAADPDCCWLL